MTIRLSVLDNKTGRTYRWWHNLVHEAANTTVYAETKDNSHDSRQVHAALVKAIASLGYRVVIGFKISDYSSIEFDSEEEMTLFLLKYSF